LEKDNQVRASKGWDLIKEPSKEEIFDLEDPGDLAYSLFEVINTLEWTDD
jgi:hypothetical protein